MSIDNFFTTLFVVRRAVWGTDGEGNPESTEQEIGDGFMGHIQQAQPELAVNMALSLTKTFLVWCAPTTNVREGDKIESVSAKYSVKAVQTNNSVGDNRHLELIVELDEINGS